MFSRKSPGRRITSPAFFMCHSGTDRTGMKIACRLVAWAANQKWTRAAKWRFAALPRPTVPYRHDRSRGGAPAAVREPARPGGRAGSVVFNPRALPRGRNALPAWSVIGLEGVVPGSIRTIARIAPLDMTGCARRAVDTWARPIVVVVIHQPGAEKAKAEIDTGIVPAAPVVAAIAPAIVTPAAAPTTVAAPSVTTPSVATPMAAATPSVAAPATITTPTVAAPSAAPFVACTATVVPAGPAVANFQHVGLCRSCRHRWCGHWNGESRCGETDQQAERHEPGAEVDEPFHNTLQ